MRGLSPGNLDYMRRLAVAWPDREVSLRVVGKVPWGHNQTLLDRVEGPESFRYNGNPSHVEPRETWAPSTVTSDPLGLAQGDRAERALR
jgi:hypothetical protein